MNSIEIEKGTNHIYKHDKKLARIIDLTGKCLLKPRKSYYISLLKAIVGQQLSITAARAINTRFLAYFNNDPSAEKILNTQDEDLRMLGLSRAKVKYVKDLSSSILIGDIHFSNLKNKSDNKIITEFTKVKGIGIWTVQMFLIFTLCRPNVLPVSDLGIRRGTMLVYGLKNLPDEKKIFLIAKKNNWAPFNSIASWYLWRSLELNDKTQ
jgi:DNA-3-methyladenine glycosylase II